MNTDIIRHLERALKVSLPDKKAATNNSQHLRASISIIHDEILKAIVLIQKEEINE